MRLKHLTSGEFADNPGYMLVFRSLSHGWNTWPSTSAQWNVHVSFCCSLYVLFCCGYM